MYVLIYSYNATTIKIPRDRLKTKKAEELYNIVFFLNVKCTIQVLF